MNDERKLVHWGAKRVEDLTKEELLEAIQVLWRQLNDSRSNFHDLYNLRKKK